MNLKSVKKEVVRDFGVLGKRFGELRVGFQKVLSKRKEEKTEEVELRDAALRKLSRLEKKPFNQGAFDDFAWVLKVFLSNRLKIDYEFTHDELVAELRKRRVKHKDDIISLSGRIVEINYEGVQVTKEEFKFLVAEAKRVIADL
ncbi:MAG: hypothetical protein ABIH63_04685 [archaeon]